MNLKQIQAIVNTNWPDSEKRSAIISVLASDKEVIPNILSILEHERHQNKELILDSNAELSRALVVLEDENLSATKKVTADPKWVAEQIKLHYTKWKDVIKCNFKVKGLQ